MANNYFDWVAVITSSRFVRFAADASKKLNDTFDLVTAGFDKQPSPYDANAARGHYGTDSGAANAYVVTLSTPAAAQVTSYQRGQKVSFYALATNTGASTINVNALGAKAILRRDGVTPLVAADIVAGQMVELQYDGSNFQMPAASGAVTLAGTDGANIQKQTYVGFTTAGTSTAYTLTPAPALGAYTANASFLVTFNAVSGAAPTLQISGIATPPNLVKQQEDGTYSNIAAGEIPLNHRSRVTLLSASQAWVEELPPQTVAPLSQCRLTKSGANVLLSPFQGNRLFVGGANRVIPSAGVTLAPPATTLTLYYIYAFMSAGVLTLEASATGYSIDTTWGHAYKTGDATRTLVGMARTVTNAWVDTVTQRFVIGYFNRRPISLQGASVNPTGITTSDVERTSAGRCEFLTFADAGVRIGSNGYMSDATFGSSAFAALAIDGAKVALDVVYTPSAVNAVGPLGTTGSFSVADGYHYSTLFGHVGSGSTGILSAQNWAEIWG